MDNWHKRKDTNKLGNLAECYVMLELAKKGIFCHKVYERFDFDLVTNNSLMIEVKSSRIVINNSKKYKPKKIWQFNNYQVNQQLQINRPNRKCDFYVMVCFDEDLVPLKYYIVPSIIINSKRVIHIPYGQKKDCQLDSFLNAWELITK